MLSSNIPWSDKVNTYHRLQSDDNDHICCQSVAFPMVDLGPPSGHRPSLVHSVFFSWVTPWSNRHPDLPGLMGPLFVCLLHCLLLLLLLLLPLLHLLLLLLLLLPFLLLLLVPLSAQAIKLSKRRSSRTPADGHYHTSSLRLHWRL